MISGEHMVVVLDDDPSILKSLKRLLAGHGYLVRLHADPDDFFSSGLPPAPACLLLDNHLGDCLTGVQVFEELLRRNWFIPTVFLTAHWDVQTVVNTMRAGADDFLTKPYDPEALVKAVDLALKRSRDNHQRAILSAAIRTRAASLSTREREIVRLVVKGLLNKEIADQLNIALVTVKIHRGRAMHKLGAGNPSELTHLAMLAGIC
jgi:FixJ family two-component response regulator